MHVYVGLSEDPYLGDVEVLGWGTALEARLAVQYLEQKYGRKGKVIPAGLLGNPPSLSVVSMSRQGTGSCRPLSYHADISEAYWMAESLHEEYPNYQFQVDEVATTTDIDQVAELVKEMMVEW